MLLWQVRAGPAAQLRAVPGVTALAWLILPWFRRQRSVLVRVAGPVAGFILLSGFFPSLMVTYLPIARPSARTKNSNRASRTRPEISLPTPRHRMHATVGFNFAHLGPPAAPAPHYNPHQGPPPQHR